jgi:hypothetical protein
MQPGYLDKVMRPKNTKKISLGKNKLQLENGSKKQPKNEGFQSCVSFCPIIDRSESVAPHTHPRQKDF